MPVGYFTLCAARRILKRNATMRSLGEIIVAVGKPVRITYAESLSEALVIQRAMRMRRVMSPSAASLAPPYFSTLSHKRHDFQQNVIENRSSLQIDLSLFSLQEQFSEILS